MVAEPIQGTDGRKGRRRVLPAGILGVCPTNKANQPTSIARYGAGSNISATRSRFHRTTTACSGLASLRSAILTSPWRSMGAAQQDGRQPRQRVVAGESNRSAHLPDVQPTEIAASRKPVGSGATHELVGVSCFNSAANGIGCRQWGKATSEADFRRSSIAWRPSGRSTALSSAYARRMDESTHRRPLASQTPGDPSP